MTHTPQTPALARPALSVRGMRRVFRDKAVVDGVDLVVEPGSFTGLLGPNGAGKSTLIGCAVGLDRPDAGSSKVFGLDVWTQPLDARRLLGVLPDNLALPEHLSGSELLGYWGRLHGMTPDTVDARANDLLQLLELDGSASLTLVRDYSTGMRKKIGIAVALIHAPRVLVLDEPFEAVDPLSAIAVRGILEQFVTAGGSVVMSSHSMLLVEHLCDAVSIMVNGRIVRTARMTEIVSEGTLEDTFISAAGGPQDDVNRELSWLT